MTHSADCQNELSTKLETTKATEAVERKYAVEDANLLRKIEMKNDILQTKIYQLRLDIVVLGSSKARIEEEIAQLKLDLEQAESSFAKEKKKLKAVYQQQVDAVFFYGYYCCMKKHSSPMISLVFHRMRKMKPSWQKESGKEMTQEWKTYLQQPAMKIKILLESAFIFLYFGCLGLLIV